MREEEIIKKFTNFALTIKVFIMVRQVFTPTESNNDYLFAVPREWYGKMVEFIAFPINDEHINETNNSEQLLENIADEHFKKLSESALAKEWDAEEDEEWNELLDEMNAI